LVKPQWGQAIRKKNLPGLKQGRETLDNERSIRGNGYFFNVGMGRLDI
jgi:hypothetical protein